MGIHLLPLGLLETVDERLREFSEKRNVLVEVFLAAYPRLCQEAAGRLRTLHNPADYPPADEDGDVRRYLYDTCLPFEVGIHLLPLGLLETVDEKLGEFKEKRGALVDEFLAAYPRLCQEAAGRLRTLYNPADYTPGEKCVPASPSVGSTSATACRNSFGRSRPGCSRPSATRPSKRCRRLAPKSSR